MKSFTGWETFVGIFSDESKQRMRTERVRNMSLAGNLQELLSKSDTIVGILKAQKACSTPVTNLRASLGQVIERRKVTMENLTAVQKRIEELNPLLLDIENKIAASTNQKDRTDLEGERSKLATEYNEKQAKEQELLAESQTLERYTSMFQTFVDSLNNQIAAQNDADQQADHRYRTAHRALQGAGRFVEDGGPTGCGAQDQHAGLQGRQHRGRDHGGHRRSRRKSTSAIFEMHEKNMVPPPTSSAARSCRRRAFARGSRSAAQAQTPEYGSRRRRVRQPHNVLFQVSRRP
jgi:hypothetical protein